MSDPAGTDAFRLHVPADPALLATVRLFVATVARVGAAAEDVVADLKLAVSEAAAAVIAAGRHDHVAVTVEVTPDTTLVRVGPLEPSDLAGDVVQPGEVISALFPGASVEREEGVLTISFTSEPAG